MGKNGPPGDELSKRMRAERERRGWTQARFAEMLTEQGFPAYFSTVSKIESGERTVRADELAIISDLLGVSADVLLGRGRSRGDAAWAAAKLSDNAGKAVVDLVRVRDQLTDDAGDLERLASNEGTGEAAVSLAQATMSAAAVVELARTTVAKLASEWPLPGVSFDRQPVSAVGGVLGVREGRGQEGEQ